MARETWVQSQAESYQRLKKWYLMLSCLTLSIIRYVSRVKESNPGKGVATPLHLGIVAIEKGAFGSSSTTVANLILLYSTLNFRSVQVYTVNSPLLVAKLHQSHTVIEIHGWILSSWILYYFIMFITPTTILNG